MTPCIMRSFLALPFLLLAACGTAQAPKGEFEPAKLITTHFGTAPKGSPPQLVWKPSATDALKYGHLPLGSVITTVDTVLHPSVDMSLVFFRTHVSYEPDEFGSDCDLCEDWLSIAVYTRGAGDRTLSKFEKWFTKQGVYGVTHKPELVEAGTVGKLVRVISSDGEMEHSSTTDHLFGIPGLREAFTVTTASHEVERGGDHGPVDHASQVEYRFIPSDKEWYDVAVNEADRAPVRWVYAPATGKYAKASTK